MLSGVFRSSPRPAEKSEVVAAKENRTNSNDDSSGNGKTKDTLSVDPVEASMTSENTGILSGLFRRSPKPSPKSAHTQDKAPVPSEPPVRDGNPSNKDSSGVFGRIFRNPFSSSAQEWGKAEPPVDTHSEAQQSLQEETSTIGGVADGASSSKQGEHIKEVDCEDDERPASAQVANDSKMETSPIPLRPTMELQGSGVEGVQEERENKKSQEQEETAKRLKEPIKAADAQVAEKADSDECVKTLGDANAEDQKEKDGKEDSANKNIQPKNKVKKKKNPFMPQVTAKGKMHQKNVAETEPASESNVQKRSLMDQLNDLRLEKAYKEEEEDLQGLMEWWSTVTHWEEMLKDEDMTEKEEAKVFAVTAEKVQKGIRVFNQLFSERAEGLWQHIIDLRAIADSLDRFNWRTKVAQVTGGSTSAVGGVATITGLALAPVTMGTSLVVTAVGLGVAAAGGLTTASAGISNAVNNSMDRKKVEKIIEDYQNKMADINKCMKFIKQGIENLRQFNLLRLKKQGYDKDFPALGNIYEDGAMAGKAVLINANEIMRVVQIANVAGSTAARAVQIASMATGILTGLFVGMDIYFVAKDSKELKKGAKSEFATKIRDVTDQLHQGLVELNTIHEELQSSAANTSPSITFSSSTETIVENTKLSPDTHHT